MDVTPWFSNTIIGCTVSNIEYAIDDYKEDGLVKDVNEDFTYISGSTLHIDPQYYDGAHSTMDFVVKAITTNDQFTQPVVLTKKDCSAASLSPADFIEVK